MLATLAVNGLIVGITGGLWYFIKSIAIVFVVVVDALVLRHLLG